MYLRLWVSIGTIPRIFYKFGAVRSLLNKKKKKKNCMNFLRLIGFIFDENSLKFGHNGDYIIKISRKSPVVCK